jgi:surface antigen
MPSRSFRFLRLLLVVALAVPFVEGCASDTFGPKTAIGGLGGAAAGGLLGAASGRRHRTEKIVAGVLIGGLLGGALGNVLDQRDRELAQRNAYHTLENAPTGSSSEWRNPDNGHYGSFTPTRTWQTGSGMYCREYQQVIVVGGERQEAYGTACRQPDGTWQIAN